MSALIEVPSSTRETTGSMSVMAEGLGKKFCKRLRRSMYYGIHDLMRNMLGFPLPTHSLRRDEFWALKNISFSLAAGESVGLIGMNGCGKSTLLRLLAGIFPPDTGEVAVVERVGALIALGAGFHPHMTGRENVYLNGTILGLHREEMEGSFEDIVRFSELEDFIDNPVATYSSGMRVRLGFAVAVNTRPDLLLVDEVIAVGDVGFRMKCYAHILKLMEQGTSIILVTHNLQQLSRITNRAMVLHHGEMQYDGDLNTGIGLCQHLSRPGDREEEAHLATSQAAWIHRVQTFNEKGEPAERFSTGDTVLIGIELRCLAPIEGARVIVAIDSPVAGILSSLSTPHAGFSFSLDPPGTRIFLRLPEIPLLVGAYGLNVSLYGANVSDFHDRILAAAEFRIVAPLTNALGFGVNHIVLFEHEWWESTGSDGKKP